MKNIKKGDIYYANLDPTIGSEQGGVRPVIVLQNNQGNKCSPTVLIAPLTKKDNNKNKIPTHIDICKNKFIKYDSIILLEQIKVIDKKRLISYLGNLGTKYESIINKALITEFNIKGEHYEI